MRELKNYLDSIEVDQKLHEKIMDAIPFEPQNSSQSIKKSSHKLQIRWTAGIASLLAVFFITWTIFPQLFHPFQGANDHAMQDTETAYDMEQPEVSVSYDEANDEVTDELSTSVMADSEPAAIGTLNTGGVEEADMLARASERFIINDVGAIRAEQIELPTGYYESELTESQIGILFPMLEENFTGTVRYREDGRIWYVTLESFVIENQTGAFGGVTINLMPLESDDEMLPEDFVITTQTPLVPTFFNDVEILVYRFNLEEDILRAEFIYLDTFYRITIEESFFTLDGGEQSGALQELADVIDLILLEPTVDLTFLENHTDSQR